MSYFLWVTLIWKECLYPLQIKSLSDPLERILNLLHVSVVLWQLTLQIGMIPSDGIVVHIFG